MILIQRPVNSRNLPLAEGVIERVIDGDRCYAQPGSGVAVDCNAGLQAMICWSVLTSCNCGSVLSLARRRGAQAFEFFQVFAL